MHVKADDAAALALLAEWLSQRGWPVVDAAGTDAEVLLPWDRDEFSAALELRAQVVAWGATHPGVHVSVDDHLWVAGAPAR